VTVEAIIFRKPNRMVLSYSHCCVCLCNGVIEAQRDALYNSTTTTTTTTDGAARKYCRWRCIWITVWWEFRDGLTVFNVRQCDTDIVFRFRKHYVHRSGRLVMQKQWERWRAKLKLVSWSKLWWCFCRRPGVSPPEKLWDCICEILSYSA